MQLCSPRHGAVILAPFGNNAHVGRYQVGHTGILGAATEAISATDKAVGTIYEACEKAGYILLITADHGNAEQMINKETGNPHTAHTTNPVPFIMTGDPKKFSFAEDKEGEEPGALSDVAPTILALLVSVSAYEYYEGVDLNDAIVRDWINPKVLTMCSE